MFATTDSNIWWQSSSPSLSCFVRCWRAPSSGHCREPLFHACCLIWQASLARAHALDLEGLSLLTNQAESLVKAPWTSFIDWVKEASFFPGGMEPLKLGIVKSSPFSCLAKVWISSIISSWFQCLQGMLGRSSTISLRCLSSLCNLFSFSHYTSN